MRTRLAEQEAQLRTVAADLRSKSAARSCSRLAAHAPEIGCTASARRRMRHLRPWSDRRWPESRPLKASPAARRSSDGGSERPAEQPAAAVAADSGAGRQPGGLRAAAAAAAGPGAAAVGGAAPAPRLPPARPHCQAAHPAALPSSIGRGMASRRTC